MLAVLHAPPQAIAYRYSDAEPRVPAGASTGGQWTSGGAGVPKWQEDLGKQAPTHEAAMKIEDAINAAHGGNPEFEAFKGAVKDWQGNSDSVNGLRTRIESTLAGGKDEQAGALLRALGRAEPTSPPLFRGIGVHDSAADVLARYPAGKEFDMPMSSFSSKVRIANKFAGWNMAGSPSGTPATKVVFTLQNGSRSVPVENLSNLWREREWLTGGRFGVVSSRKEGEYVKVILKQRGVFNVK